MLAPLCNYLTVLSVALTVQFQGIQQLWIRMNVKRSVYILIEGTSLTILSGGTEENNEKPQPVILAEI
jgi:hypothetical protein